MKAIVVKVTEIMSSQSGAILTDIRGAQIEFEQFISGSGRVNISGVVKSVELIKVNRIGIRITMESGQQFEYRGNRITVLFPTHAALVKYFEDAIERVKLYLNASSTVMRQHFTNRNGFIEAQWELKRLEKELQAIK